jgi:hypothetical protein
MNAPNNLLFDAEIAMSRLREAFEPAPDADSSGRRKTRPSQSRVKRSPMIIKEGPVDSSFAAPEVNGCVAICFQPL